MGSKRNVDMSSTTDKVKHFSAENESSAEVNEEKKDKKSKNIAKQTRSKKYTAARSKLDKTKLYTVEEAVKIVQELSYSKFDGTISADGVIKEVGTAGSITFPNSTGKKRRIAVLDDQLLSEIEGGKIEFDVLVAHPQYMPKLAKFAKVLGPRGLMPNPKTGTLTPNPESKKKELEAGSLVIKTEKKLPVIHISVGKVSMKTQEITDNINELVRVLGPKLKKLSISASMSPAVRIKVD